MEAGNNDKSILSQFIVLQNTSLIIFIIITFWGCTLLYPVWSLKGNFVKLSIQVMAGIRGNSFSFLFLFS